MKSKSRIFWFTLRIGPSSWDVYFTDALDERLGDETEGACTYSESRIYLDKSIPKSRYPDVLLHEILHAVIFSCGFKDVLGLDSVSEEKVVGLLAPALSAVLRPENKTGFLVLPKLPKGL